MSIIKHVTLQKIVAHDFRYDPRKIMTAKCLLFISKHASGRILCATNAKQQSPCPFCIADPAKKKKKERAA